jgi:hypothetical protein
MVALAIPILEVPGSNHGQDSTYPVKEICHCFLKPSKQIPGYTSITSRLRSSKFFPIHPWSIHQTPRNLATESVLESKR